MSKGKEMSLAEAQSKIKEKFPNWSFQILSFEKATSPIILKCLDCQKEKQYKNIYNFLYKKDSCDCNSSASQNKLKRMLEESLAFLKESKDLELVEITTMKDEKKKPALEIYCKKCKNTFIRRVPLFSKNKSCPYCARQGRPTTSVIESRLAEKGYTLLSEYKNNKEKVLIRHEKCGFIWKISMDRNRELNGSCPLCNRRVSKGEQKIIHFLQNHKIAYEKEKRFPWQSHSQFRYDFYIKDYNLIIEYNGRQHYEETNIFSSSLQENQEHDEIKREEAIQNGYYFLIIPYTHYNKIDDILQKWLNDYPKGVNNKLMIIERDTTEER